MKTISSIIFLLLCLELQGATINLSPISNKSGTIYYSRTSPTPYSVSLNTFSGIGKSGNLNKRLFYYFDLTSIKNSNITSCKMNINNIYCSGDGPYIIYVTNLGNTNLPLNAYEEHWNLITKKKVVAKSPEIKWITQSTSIDLTDAIKYAISQNQTYIALGYYFSSSATGINCTYSNLIVEHQPNYPQTPTFTTSRNENNVTLNMYSKYATSYSIAYTDYSSSTDWTMINNITSQSYTLNLDANKTYLFKVKASNPYGTSSWSNINFDYNTNYDNILVSNYSVKSIGNNWNLEPGLLDGDDYAFKIKISSPSWVNINAQINESSSGVQIFDINGNPLSILETIRNTWCNLPPNSSMKTILTPGEYILVIDNGASGGNNIINLTLNSLSMPVHNIPFQIHGSTEIPYDFWNTDGYDAYDKTYLVYLDHPDDVYIGTNFGSPETNFNTILQVFKLDYTSTGLYNDDSNDGSGASNINGYLPAGYYFIVVDGWSDDSGDFLLKAMDWYSSEYSDYINNYSDYSYSSIFGTSLKSGKINNTYNPSLNNTEKVKKEQPNTDIEISCFPNPVQNEINLIVPKLESIAKSRIFNSRGEIVKDLLISDSKTKISCEELSSGLYFIKIQIEGKMHVLKFNVIK